MRLSCIHSLMAVLALCCLLAAPAWGGRSRPGYVDGGQSADGRFVVTVELIEEPAKGKGGKSRTFWRFTWKDTREGTTHSGELASLRSGRSQQQEPVHAHIYVAPDGQTFAVWNAQAYAIGCRGPASAKQGPVIMDAAFRTDPAFANRLTIYRCTGEIVKALAINDFMQDQEWACVVHDQVNCVHWLQMYPGFDSRNTPRYGYAFHRISPDHTVLECTIGSYKTAYGTPYGDGKIKPRVVRVSLSDGRIFSNDDKPAGVDQTPVQPFIGELASQKDGEKDQHHYVPSLDPLRIAGKFAKPADGGTQTGAEAEADKKDAGKSARK